MTKKKENFSLGNIIETVFSNLDSDLEYSLTSNDDSFGEIIDFCIDSKGQVRKTLGMVAYDEVSEIDPNYVPQNRYQIESAPWNSHSLYFEIELPNPAADLDYYLKIRSAMMAEFTSRFNRAKKNAQARLRTENKKLALK